MPLYEYHCVDCGVQDSRIGGLDDHAALCIRCGGMMLRRNEDVFGPYFDQDELRLRPEPAFHTGGLGRTTA